MFEIIQVTLKTKFKDPMILLPMEIQILGEPTSKKINIISNSIGPVVELKHKKELEFNKGSNIQVLKDYSAFCRLHNKSPIIADFHCFTRDPNSIFKPRIKRGKIVPEGVVDIEVVCQADDIGNFSDVLHFVIQEGEDIDVQLKARATGSTIWCSQNIEQNGIDFGTQFTYKNATEEIFVENKGARVQFLTWQRKPEAGKVAKQVVETNQRGRNNQ